MIIVVGSREDTFHFMGPNKVAFFHEHDPMNVFYNEMCGYRAMLADFQKIKDEPYVGLEHYRRAFAYSDAEIRDILTGYDVIVKDEHGPYGSLTNLQVLACCSRHWLDYLQKATEWVERFPELREQADRKTHYGCNMMVTTPGKLKAMMEEEFGYIREFLKEPNLQRSIISYFCETILTPHIIRKHNLEIFVGKVVMP